MRKFRKKLASILSMCLIVIFVFAGCGKANAPAKEEPKATGDSESENKAESEEKWNEDTILKIGDALIRRDEMFYYIYQREEEGNEMEQIHQSAFGESYWDSEAEEGKTFREKVKEETLDAAIMYEIFYEKAKGVGYELSSEEKEKIKEDAKEGMEELTNQQIKIIGMTQERLEEIFEKISIATEYYQDFMDGLEINEDEATSQLIPEEHRQYDVEYIYAPTVTYDENYEPTPYSKKKKQAAHKKMQKLLNKALKSDKDLEDLVPEDDDTLETSTIGFLKGDQMFGKSFEKEALKLKNGETADHLVEEADGYYIIRMVDDNSTEAYDSAVDAALDQARSEAFEQAFEKMKEDYVILVNEEVWEPLVIGEITYDPNAAANSDLYDPETEEDDAIYDTDEELYGPDDPPVDENENQDENEEPDDKDDKSGSER